ncbi:MAG: flavin reductase family protein [Methanomassiliicoccales archaeon]
MVAEPERIDLEQSEAIAALPPAPVMLVCSGSKEEDWNVTTIGMFNVFSLFPIVVGIGIKTSRNMYRLIADSEDFTINVPTAELLQAVEICGREAGARKNKFKEAGLTPQKGRRVASPIVKECPLNIEVKKLSSGKKKTMYSVHQGEMDIGDHTWFLGQIVHTDMVKDYDRTKALLFWDGEYRLAEKCLKGKEE